MIQRPPSSTRTDTLFPSPTRCRLADLEPVALLLMVRPQNRDILLVQLDDRLVADDVHIGADDLREDARLGRAEIRLPRLDAKFRRAHRVAHRPALIERHGQLAAHRQRAARRVEARSEEHTSELQSLMRISYAVFCLKKKNKPKSKTRE